MNMIRIVVMFLLVVIFMFAWFLFRRGIFSIFFGLRSWMCCHKHWGWCGGCGRGTGNWRLILMNGVSVGGDNICVVIGYLNVLSIQVFV